MPCLVALLLEMQANPDQSKHLETANVRVMGYEIDCVNLRAETYTGRACICAGLLSDRCVNDNSFCSATKRADSRIPEIRHGTALEDALRR